MNEEEDAGDDDIPKTPAQEIAAAIRAAGWCVFWGLVVCGLRGCSNVGNVDIILK